MGNNDAKSIHMLVGRYFHTTTICPEGIVTAEWQGHVIGAPAPGVLLIETFEWVFGEVDGQELISLNDFMARNPVLYQDSDEMDFSLRHGRLRHSFECRCEKNLGNS